MKKTAFISDIVFAGFACFLFTLCLFRYVGVRLGNALLLAVICGILMGSAVWAILKSKRNRFFLKKSEQLEKEKLLLHLTLLSDEEKTRFFLDALSMPDRPAKRFQKLRVITEEGFYALHFTMAPLTADEILRFSRLKSNKQKIILCSKIDAEGLSLAKELHVRILVGEEVYAMLKELEALPSVYLSTANTTVEKGKRKLWFVRSNAKPFFISSILLLITALISPFPYYYLWFGGGLLLSSLLVRIFGYE